MNKNKKKIKKNKKNNTKTLNKISIFTIVSCLVLFGLIAILVATNNISWFDKAVYSIVSKMICKPMTVFFKAITMLCETELVLIILALLIIFMKNKKRASYIVVNTGLCVLLNQLVKRIFLRARPFGIALITQGGYSFPSGHSMIALAFYGLLIYIIQNSSLDKIKKVISTIILGLLIFLIGLSRIYLGVHFASDVLGGFALSLAYLVLFINFIYKKKEK